MLLSRIQVLRTVQSEELQVHGFGEATALRSVLFRSRCSGATVCASHPRKGVQNVGMRLHISSSHPMRRVQNIWVHRC